MRLTSHRKGIISEYLAALLLICKGYAIKERRYKTAWGEIDLIAKRGHTLIFVEVKRRKDYYTGLSCITATQRSRIEKAGQFYLSQAKVNFESLRFDVIVATSRRLYHLKDAWQTI